MTRCDHRSPPRRASLTGSLVLLLAAAVGAAEITPPVLIERGVLFTPKEIAELGLAPEVDLVVHLDARGVVTDVEVTGIRPSTEEDEIVAEATRDLIRTWHYAPARESNGTPTESRLEWTMRFRSFGSSSNAETGEAPSIDPLRRIGPSLAIPQLTRQRRIELLERYAAKAELSLIEGRRSTHTTPRFIVHTDAEQPNVAEIVGNNFEATFHFLDQLFGPSLELLPPTEKVLVYFYSTQSSFASAVSGFGSPSHFSGLYVHPGLVMLKQDLPNNEALLHTLLHEATHAYTARYLAKPGTALPAWFMEGLAEYVGNSTVSRKGEIVVGKAIKRRFMMDPHGYVALRTTNTGWDLDRTKEAFKKGEAPTIPELFPLPPELFTGPRGPLNYATSWLLIHFLRHGDAEARGAKGAEGGWANVEFPRFLLYLLEGYPAEETIEQVYGATLSELQEQFAEYVRRF